MAAPEVADDSDLFATPAELAAKTQGYLDADAAETLRALTAATAEIRKVAGWHIAPQVMTRHRATRLGPLVFLPTLHLVELLSVTSDGTAVDISTLDYALEEATDGVLQARSVHDWSGRRGGVVATFTHGHAEVPDELKDLCMQVAARALGSPLGIVREQTLASSVTWSSTASGVAGGTVILEHEKPVVDRYRIATL